MRKSELRKKLRRKPEKKTERVLGENLEEGGGLSFGSLIY